MSAPTQERQPLPKLAFTYDEAAEACGYSRTVIRQAVYDGDLVARYANRKPVIETAELERWLHGLPSVPPAEKKAAR